MTDVIRLNGITPAIIHPAAIREVHINDDRTNQLVVITADTIHSKDFDTEDEAKAALEKISEYLNVIEVI